MNKNEKFRQAINNLISEAMETQAYIDSLKAKLETAETLGQAANVEFLVQEIETATNRLDEQKNHLQRIYSLIN